MEIKPSKEKKKKKGSKKRGHEIRRWSSVMQNAEAELSKHLLAPSAIPFATHSAPGSQRGSLADLSEIETIKEPEEESVETIKKLSCHNSEELSNIGMDDLWKHTLPIALIESTNTGKTKSRRGSIRRRSSGGSEADTMAAVNSVKRKSDACPQFFWDDVKESNDSSKREP